MLRNCTRRGKKLKIVLILEDSLASDGTIGLSIEYKTVGTLNVEL